MPNTAASVLQQPGSYAWQVFDSQVDASVARRIQNARRHQGPADTLEELVNAHAGRRIRAGFLKTIARIQRRGEARRAVRSEHQGWQDARSGLKVDKTNWANTIEKPPFEAYSVGCGITFTFGGLKIDTACHVLDIEDMPIAGLYAAGELVGGLFYFNYPGSAGLMAGAVFGRMAGREAALHAVAGAKKS